MTRFALAANNRKIGAVRGAAPQLPLFPPDDPYLDQPGQRSGFSVRESARAKRLSIKVFPRGKVEVVVPRRTRPAEVEKFVAENQDWIRRARESFAVKHPQEAFRLPQRIELLAVGRSVPVRYQAEPQAKSVRYRYRHGELLVSGRIGDDMLCVKAIRRWLAVTARQEYALRLQALSALTGISYTKLQIRAQRTCWGSRSSSGTISLNLCLLFLQPEVLRYLLLHELCHGRHMNHSKRFWALVGRFEPEYRRLDRELTECWRYVPSWLGIY